MVILVLLGAYDSFISKKNKRFYGIIDLYGGDEKTNAQVLQEEHQNKDLNIKFGKSSTIIWAKKQR